MQVLLALLAAAFLFATSAFAHTLLGHHVAGERKLWLIRIALVLTGLAFGYVSGQPYQSDPARAVLAFMIGFGAVHFPAACILLIKQARRSGKS